MLKSIWWNTIVVFIILLWSPCITDSVTLPRSYSDARTIRALQGHDMALPLFQELLCQNPHDVTAATRIASHPDAISRHLRLGYRNPCTDKEYQSFIQLLGTWNFTPLGIAKHIFPGMQPSPARHSSAPLYLQPLRAGTKAPPLPTCALETCIQLFLMAVCVPFSKCQEYLGETTLDMLETMGIAFCDEQLVVPYCHITPIHCGSTTLYLATDLHPNVLSTNIIDDENETVMYIGPDSIALVDHWNSLPRKEAPNRIVDLGTGSGIQALTMATALRSPEMTQVVCVDLNPRSLRLTRLNFVWNGLPEPMLILGDLRDKRGGRLWDYAPTGNIKPWREWIGHATIILANPPFLPVPVQDNDIAKRHGLFSSGGESGEEILQRVVTIASECLDSHGTLAVVSEFMNPQTTFLSRLQQWWKGSARGVLFSNEQSINASTYALRRADSPLEFKIWMDNLSTENISHVSPGLLFMEKDASSTWQLETVLVPKTANGSIWTPTNAPARDFTRQKLIELGIYQPLISNSGC